LRVQLWSWNYDPEPTAMGPIAGLWAREMAARGHDVEVLTGFPHYPPDIFPQSLRPYREHRDGVRVLRIPLLIGHSSAMRRIGEEVTYALSAAFAAALARGPDVVIAVSPSFLALLPVAVRSRLERTPLILWLQDILPDAAVTTGLVRDGLLVGLARRYERWVYASADRIVVISDTFLENLRSKGVDLGKLVRLYNPATRDVRESVRVPPPRARILAMGNIGFSQGLAEHVRAFEASAVDATLVIAGTGELEGAVRREVRTSRVQVLGLVSDVRLQRELDQATLALVTQREDVVEFNVPSKLATFMSQGLPVLASVRPSSEVARIVERSGGGWVSTLADFPKALALALADPSDVSRRSRAAVDFARGEFDPRRFAASFEEVLVDVVAKRTG
jgi:colanic acid biosynthesis glycosyl transferase WcaI